MRVDEFEFVAFDELQRRPSLRADADPVQPSGASRVPFVSTATSNPASWNAPIAASSSCSSGSPPVQTTNAWSREGAVLSHVPATLAARSAAVAYFPPPVPLVPTKSVSQNWQMARCRSFFPPGPQVARRESAEDRSPSRVRPLPLQCREDLLDLVSHPAHARAVTATGSSRPSAANPRRRSRHESQVPQETPASSGS